MKEIYRFKVEKSKEENAEVTTFVMKKPSRIEREELDIFYAAKFKEYTDRGLLTKAMLSKKYADNGGILSELEKTEYAENLLALYNCEQDILKLSQSKEENKDKIEELVKKMGEARENLQEFQTYKNVMLENTADAKAENKAVFWLVLFLTYVEKDGKLAPFFEGETFEEKIEKYDVLDEAEDDYSQEVINRLFTYFTLFYLGHATKPEDFEKALNPPKQ